MDRGNYLDVRAVVDGHTVGYRQVLPDRMVHSVSPVSNIVPQVRRRKRSQYARDLGVKIARAFDNLLTEKLGGT